MKFVCERCHTRYSIADDKVRQKILKIRCKTCENVITVRDPGPGSAEAAAPPPPPPRAGAAGAAAAREWFVATNGEQVGPMTRTDAARRILQAKDDDEVYVWKDGLDGWKPPAEVAVIHQEVVSLKAQPRNTGPARLPTPPSPRAAVKAPPRGAAPAGGKPSVLPGKGASPIAASGGRGPAPATARLAENDSFAEEEHTQIQPFDAALFAPEGFARPSQQGPSPGPGSVLPFTAPGKADRATNGQVPAVPAPALEGLFSDLTPVPVPVGGAVSRPMGVQLSGLSQMTGRRSPVVKFVAAGAVVAVLIALVVIVLVSRPDTKVVVAPPPPVPKPAVVEDPQPRTDPEKSRPVVENVPPPVRDVPGRRTGKAPLAKHPTGGPIAPQSLEPAPLSPGDLGTTATAKRPGGGPERRVQEYRGNRGAAGAAAGDGPTETMIIAVVRKNQATIKTCYERALKRDDRLRSGRIDVTAELGSSGTVKSVSLASPPEFATVEACIKTAVRRWAFPVAPHDYRAEFPLILQGNL
jgi:predicted Zn finger-like uncharacterized protein